MSLKKLKKDTFTKMCNRGQIATNSNNEEWVNILIQIGYNYRKYKGSNECPHCEFIEKTFGDILKSKDSTNREYWLMTEVFVYLHGSDICNLTTKIIKHESNH